MVGFVSFSVKIVMLTSSAIDCYYASCWSDVFFAVKAAGSVVMTLTQHVVQLIYLCLIQ